MIKSFHLLPVLIVTLALSACSSTRPARTFFMKPSDVPATQGKFKVGNPYKVGGRTYTPQETYNFTQTGIASWYGPDFHGKFTANGEIYNQRALTAAHKTLQMPSIVRVTNLENGRSLIVRVNDRGPFSKNRVIDMSERGAELLQFKGQGTTKVKIQLLERESRMIAQAAKEGHSITDIEIALNQGKTIEEALGYPPAQEDQIQTASLAPPQQISPQIPQQMQQAQQMQPVPITQQQAAPQQATYSSAVVSPVQTETLSAPQIPAENLVKTVSVPRTRIYIQTGSFTNLQNANAYAGQMAPFGAAQIKPTVVNGQTFYRVRLPAQTVAEADELVLNLAKHGKRNTMIIVE